MAGEGFNDSEVPRILAQIVSHFNQPIHDVEDVIPYFTAGKNPPIESSEVLKFCIHRVASCPDPAIWDWIIGYETTIRNVFFLEHPVFPIPVLQGYEIIFFIWLKRLNARPMESELPTSKRLASVITCISIDIRGALRESRTYSNALRCNVLVPTLLRILNHMLHLLRLHIDEYQGNGPMESWVECCEALLPFVLSRIDPRRLLPCLLSHRGLEELCIHIPHNITLQYLFSLDGSDWEELILDGKGIIFADNADVSRTLANEAWANLASLMHCEACQTEHHPLYGEVVSLLGKTKVAQVIQRRFHGLDAMNSYKPKTESKLLHGRLVERPVSLSKENPYQEDPSLILSLVNLVCLLSNKDHADTVSLVNALVPCCLQLIDSTNPMHVGFGYCALARVMVVLDNKSDAWRMKKKEIILKMEDSIRCHRQGAVVIVLGRCQLAILENLGDNGKVYASFSKQWILNLHQVLHKPTSNQAWELLVGAVIPSLQKLAKLEGARGIELGRVGLSVLLPMVIDELVDIRTRVGATMALINLMVAAYPIMPHHGGKILCHLLSALSFGLADNDSSDESRAAGCLMKHAAALCLVVCGSSARDILKDIETDKEKYQDFFLDSLSEVQKMSAYIDSKKLVPST